MPEKAPEPKFDLVGAIMAFETGEATTQETLRLFSVLIQTGKAWSLQGAYGRNAHALIEAGYITKDGIITKKGLDLS